MIKRSHEHISLENAPSTGKKYPESSLSVVALAFLIYPLEQADCGETVALAITRGAHPPPSAGGAQLCPLQWYYAKV